MKMFKLQKLGMATVLSLLPLCSWAQTADGV